MRPAPPAAVSLPVSDTTGHLGLADGDVGRQLKRPVAQAPPLDAYCSSASSPLRMAALAALRSSPPTIRDAPFTAERAAATDRSLITGPGTTDLGDRDLGSVGCSG
jgi:hypothetical protein